MKMGDLGCCANIIRFLLIIINSFFIVVALTIVGGSGWLMNKSGGFSFVTGKSVINGGAVVIAGGIITIIGCAFGIIGTIFKLRVLLVIYAVVMVLIVLGEITTTSVGFAYREAIDNFVHNRSLEAIRIYNPVEISAEPNSGESVAATLAVDLIERELQCCGYNSPHDWLQYNPSVVSENGNRPPNCPQCTVLNLYHGTCHSYNYSSGTLFPTPFGYQQFSTNVSGCRVVLEDRISMFSLIVGGTGAVIGIMEIIGVVFAIALCCCITIK